MHAALRVLYATAATLASAASGITPAGGGKTGVALRARHGIRDRYQHWAATHRDAGRPLVWMHAPSVGEGLQARPVLSLLRARHPELQLAYTFFSPSAVDFAGSLDVDFRDYLPFDAAADMAAALDALRPTALIFSKLDVWPELVRQARRRGVKLGMISAALAAASGRRGPLAGALLRDAYAMLDAVGAVDPADAERLVQLGVRPEAIEITGDTRFDQVAQRASAVDRGSLLLSHLATGQPTLVAGSTWPADETPVFAGFLEARSRIPALRMIVAPHEMTETHLGAVELWAQQHRLTLHRVDAPEANEADIILVDRFGVLGELYALADVAFVGGGFHDAGLHSVLEPAAYGAPVLFGPKHTRSRDAVMLLASGGARSVATAGEVAQALHDWFASDEARRQAGARASAMVEKGRGAAERSLHLVERLMRS